MRYLTRGMLGTRQAVDVAREPRKIESTLQTPEPRAAIYKNTKQYKTAGSPLLMMGKKATPFGLKWTIKYATAIIPLARKAAMPVKSPIIIRMPPTSSMVPPTAMSGDKPSDEGGAPGDCGKPSSFWLPCHIKRKPATIRNIA